MTHASPPPSSLSVCPRHPDREAYVLCQRCGRPACPQCQVQAAVGVQCVDCYRQGQATVRKARTRAGAVVHDGPPVVTYGFIAACVVAFVLQRTVPMFTLDYGFAPIMGHREPWRYLTSAFLHDDTSVLSVHLLLNMYAMWALGQGIEPQLGRLRYAATLFLSAIGGSVAFQLIAGADSNVLLIGASSVVFGLFGVLLSAGRSMGVDMRGVVAVVALNVLLGFSISGIAWQGHLGGLVVGLILGAVFTRGTARTRLPLQIGGCLALFVALIVLALV